MDPIRVAVIEDNPRFRHIIREVIAQEKDMQICDEADTFKNAKDILSASSPDIAILDLSVDEHEGALKFLQEIGPNVTTGFIILSAHSEANYSAKSLQAGAKGYVCKDKTVRCLANAIRSVCAGKEFVSSK